MVPADLGQADLPLLPPDPSDLAPAGFGLGSISPSIGPSSGGIPVTLSGGGFTPGMTVTFDDVPASQIQLLSATQMVDFQNFSTSFGATYFSKVRAALKADGLTSLYLGCRFADYTPEIVQAAEPYVDVQTFGAKCDDATSLSCSAAPR